MADARISELGDGGAALGTDKIPISRVDTISNAYLLASALTALGVSSITGTANQITASTPTGVVTLSLPQSIATTSTPTFGGLTLTGQLVVPVGSTATPAILFNGTTTAGFIAIAAHEFGWVSNGNNPGLFGNNRFNLSSGAVLGWSSTTDPNVGADLKLVRNSAGILEFRNGTNPQGLLIDNTWTDASNYERASLSWASNIFDIQTQKLGTGTGRVLRLGAGGTGFWTLGLSGQIAVAPAALSGTPSTTGSYFNVATSTFTDSATAGSGTVASFAAHAFQAPTLAASNASVTTTNASTVYISGAPIAGTNETLTNAWALNVAAGNVNVGGAITLAGALTIAGLIRFNGTNSTGAGTALLATNCPAVTATAPYTWLSALAADGSTVFIPVWK